MRQSASGESVSDVCSAGSGCRRARLARGKSEHRHGVALPCVRQGSDHGRRLFRRGLATGISARNKPDQPAQRASDRISGHPARRRAGHRIQFDVYPGTPEHLVRLPAGRHSGGRLRAQGRQPHLPGRHRIGYDPQRRRGDRPLRSAGSERRGADHDQARPHTAPDGEHRRRGRFSGSDAPAEIPRIVRLRTSLQRSGGQRRRIAQIRPVCARLLPQRRRPLQLSRRRLDGQIHEKILRRAALQRKRAGRHGARALLRLRRIRGQFGSLQRGQERQHL